MSKAEDDAKLPPLQLELEFDEKPTLAVGELSDPGMFEIGYNIDPEHEGLVLLFPSSGYAILFKDQALQKFLAKVDVLIHAGLESVSPSSSEGAAEGKKKVTLH